MLVLLSALLLGMMLWVGRVRDRARTTHLEGDLAGVMSGEGRSVLGWAMLGVDGARFASRLCQTAVASSNRRRLRLAVRLARLEVQQLLIAFRAMTNLTRTVTAVVDLPPVRFAPWRAWRLRGVAGVGVLLHQVLVTAAERARLRLWVLSTAFRYALRTVRLSAIHLERDPRRWSGVVDAAADLATAADEAEVTCKRLVGSLDVVGALTEARARLTRA